MARVAYLDFISEFGRSYATVAQFNHRFETFEQNYLRIKDHNSNIDVPFTMAVN